MFSKEYKSMINTKLPKSFLQQASIILGKSLQPSLRKGDGRNSQKHSLKHTVLPLSIQHVIVVIVL
jgi:hypothetical protein